MFRGLVDWDSPDRGSGSFGLQFKMLRSFTHFCSFGAFIPMKPLETFEVHEPFASDVIKLRTDPLPGSKYPAT